MIFEMYTNGKNLGEIIQKLNELNIKTQKGNKKWYKTYLQVVLTNITYTGKIKYVDKQYIKRVVNGSLILVKNPNPDVYIVKGLHEPIISEETFEKAQAIYKSHQLADTRTKEQFELKNPLSTLLKCKICGRTMQRFANGHCNNIGCRNYDVGSSRLNIIEERVFEGLKEILSDYKFDLSNYSKSEEIQTSIKVIEKQISQLHIELEKTNSQKSKLYDFLEQGIYTNEIFLERSNELANRILEINQKIEELLKSKKDYETTLDRKEQIIPNIEKVIESYPYADVNSKNKLLKSCIEKIEYYKPKGDRSLDGFEIKIFPRL